MQSTSILLVLLAATSVSAIFRSLNYRRHDGPYHPHPEPHHPEPHHPHPHPEPKCPPGFTAFRRAPEPAYCLKAAVQKTPISVDAAKALCAAQASGAVLTSFANKDEQDFVSGKLLEAVKSYGYVSGAIAIDGRRIANCSVMDRAVLNAAPCNNPLKSFNISDKHTNPTYMLKQFAVNEPSSNMWTYDVEQCLQLAVVPADKQHDKLLNDIYCNFVHPPNDPENTQYWNFGALCGIKAYLGPHH